MYGFPPLPINAINLVSFNCGTPIASLKKANSQRQNQWIGFAVQIIFLCNAARSFFNELRGGGVQPPGWKKKGCRLTPAPSTTLYEVRVGPSQTPEQKFMGTYPKKTRKITVSA